MALLEKGGYFILPLLICSIVMVAVVIERVAVFWQVLQKPLFTYDHPSAIIKKLRSHLMILYTVIVIAPMLGLLGTVVGLMKCFHLLGTTAVSTFDPKTMSMGISEALLTTAAGLAITIIATIFYNYFNACLDSYVLDYNNALIQEEPSVKENKDE
jgi:biopolymer transport protein ExbB